MPDRVHAVMEAVKAAGAYAVVDRGNRESECPKLPARDDSVLSTGEAGDDLVDGAKTAHIAV